VFDTQDDSEKPFHFHQLSHSLSPKWWNCRLQAVFVLALSSQEEAHIPPVLAVYIQQQLVHAAQ
jgi:hypothetical protein